MQERTVHFEKLIHSLTVTIPELGENFDGYGGMPPSHETLQSVMLLLAHIRDTGLPLPSRTQVAGDGEVGLVWKKHGLSRPYAEFCVDAEDCSTAYGIMLSEGDKCRGFDDIKVSAGLPDEVRRYLKSHF